MLKLRAIAVIITGLLLTACGGGEALLPTATSPASQPTTVGAVLATTTPIALTTGTAAVAAELPTVTPLAATSEPSVPTATSVVLLPPTATTASARPTNTTLPPRSTNTTLPPAPTATSVPPRSTSTAVSLTTSTTAPLPPTATSVPPAPTETPMENKPPTQQPVATWPAEADAAVNNAKVDLANKTATNLQGITVKRVTATNWRDSSLGCPRPDEMYMTVIVPGYTIILAADGQDYEYHADQSGRVVTCSQPASPEQAIAERAARNDLARRLQTEATAIQIVSAKAQQWPDSSIGCSEPGTAYLDVTTPGYLIMLGYEDQLYEYHTDLNNRVVQCKDGRPVK